MRPSRKRVIIIVAVIAVLYLCYQFFSISGISSDYDSPRHKYHGVMKLVSLTATSHPSTVDGEFFCTEDGTELPQKFVNDDYCDCPDGSDEPLTSACSNVDFKCKNGHIIGHPDRMHISSGRVNDGICDCCDGSDELVPPHPGYLRGQQLFFQHFSRVPIIPCRIVC